MVGRQWDELGVKFILVILIIMTVSVITTMVAGEYQPSSVSLDTIEDVSSPADFVSLGDITYNSNEVRLKISNAKIVRFADTNSMDPIIDSSANGIMVKVSSPNELIKGDIIAFKYEDNTIVHRIIAIGNDGELFYITKGDNLKDNDGIKVRFDTIVGKIVGILY